MKKISTQEYIQSFSIIVVALSIALGMGVAHAWTAPSCNPPLCNDGGPVTTGPANEAKIGGLTIGNATYSGATTLSVERTTGTTPGEACDGVDNNSNGQVDEGCPLLTSAFSLHVDGNTTFVGPLAIGIFGGSGTSNLIVQPMPLAPSTVRISTLSHSYATPQKVCTDATGVLYLCNGNGSGGNQQQGGL